MLKKQMMDEIDRLEDENKRINANWQSRVTDLTILMDALNARNGTIESLEMERARLPMMDFSKAATVMSLIILLDDKQSKHEMKPETHEAFTHAVALLAHEAIYSTPESETN